MDPLPDDVDPRIAYLVMLNGTEESTLHELLWDIGPRGLVPQGQAREAASRALTFLIKVGWLDVARGTMPQDYRVLDPAECGEYLGNPKSWEDPDEGGDSSVSIILTDEGRAEWIRGCGSFGLTIEERGNLFYPKN